MPMPMRKPTLIVLSLLTFLLAAASHGDETARQFEVELILFANLNAYDGGESWPGDDRGDLPHAGWDTPPQTGLTAPQDATPERRDAWQRLPDSGRRLTAVADALRRSNNYRPLAHLHWRQTVLGSAAAQAIDLEELLGVVDRQASHHVEGSIRLSVARFLHLETDLLLREGGSDYQRDRSPEYRLQQSRRMRSGELHYIDHPRFGILAQITPYTEAQ